MKVKRAIRFLESYEVPGPNGVLKRDDGRAIAYTDGICILARGIHEEVLRNLVQ